MSLCSDIFQATRHAAAGKTPSVPGGTSPPNTQENVEIVMPNLYCVFGGAPIESRDGESLEGVGETNINSGIHRKRRADPIRNRE